MKRAGNLWAKVLEPENFRAAFLKAARGKRDRPAVRRFASDLEANLAELREAVASGSMRLGDFHRFTVHDPKERVIHAAAFPERVVHHAVMAVCEPFFERRLIHHCYACRSGKGQYAALEAARRNARRAGWYLKLDIRKYFDSIPHQGIHDLLGRIFKDRHLLAFFARLLDCYATEPGRGLPIGSLTSQHLANAYLGDFDRKVLNLGEVRGYVRYMDDFVAWGDDSPSLRVVRLRIEDWVGEMGLALKTPGTIQPVRRGMSLLGYRVYPGRMFLARRSRMRYERKSRWIMRQLAERQEEWAAERLRPLSAFAEKGEDVRWRTRAVERIWRMADGLEPRQPRRQLEQQRAELPLRESQQEHAGQYEQQPRFPPRAGPQLRPNMPKEQPRED